MARGSSISKAASISKPARRRKFAPKEVKPSDSIEGLQELRIAAVSNFASVKNTNNAYNGHRARGRAFLADLVKKRKKDEHLNGPNTDGICTAGLEKAFDDTGPNQYSALVLELFLVQKCFNEGCTKDTSDGIHGAFAALWDQIEGGKYAGEYHYDEATGEVRGCPARAANVRAVVHSVRVRDKDKGASATRNHAEAMTVEDLRKIMTWSERECPSDKTGAGDEIDGLIHRLEHGLMRAFLTSGFTLWTRCFELLDLQPQDIKFNSTGPPPHNLPCFKVELLNRKGWQNEKGYEGPREPHVYNIYPQPHRSEMDMYRHLLEWKVLLEGVLRRPLADDEYLFPHIGVNGVIRPDRKMSYDSLMKLLTHFCKQSGVAKRYTTHSLRRGGAQYRFMYGPFGQRWDLNRIRWWGGWAIGEECDTLIKYLVDSLQSLQNDHGDALNPFGDGGRTDADYFMGGNDTSPPSTTEFRAATTATNEKIVACLEAVQNLARNQPIPRQLSHILGTSPPTASASDCARTTSNSLCESLPEASEASSKLSHRSKKTRMPRTIPLSNVSIPGLGRKQGAWRRALKQWTEVDPKTGLALMDWPLEWYTGNMKSITGSLRGQREVVFKEYQRLGGTDQRFLLVYPDADESLKRLIDAIRANPDSRTGQQRSSKNGTPEARGSREPQSRSPSEMVEGEMDVDRND